LLPHTHILTQAFPCNSHTKMYTHAHTNVYCLSHRHTHTQRERGGGEEITQGISNYRVMHKSIIVKDHHWVISCILSPVLNLGKIKTEIQLQPPAHKIQHAWLK